jgi:hypothetical protein
MNGTLTRRPRQHAPAPAQRDHERSPEPPGAQPAGAQPIGGQPTGLVKAGPALSLGAPEKEKPQPQTVLQPKLAVSRPGDAFEREANHVADQVTSGGRVPQVTPLGPAGLAEMAQPWALQACESCPAHGKQESVQRCSNCTRRQDTQPGMQAWAFQRGGVQRQEQAAGEEEANPDETEAVQTLPVMPWRRPALQLAALPPPDGGAQRDEAEPQEDAGDEDQEAPEAEGAAQARHLPAQTWRQPAHRLEAGPAEEAGEDEEQEEAPEAEGAAQAWYLPAQAWRQPAHRLEAGPAEEAGEDEEQEEAPEAEDAAQAWRAPLQRAEAEDDHEETGVEGQGAVQEACAGCDEETSAETTPAAQKADSSGSNGSAPAGGSPGAAISHPGGGEPLTPPVRAHLEEDLGVDLSGVRVHTSAQDRQAAKGLHARAFTHGQDIWLGPGESQNDMRLMAHESAHVVQQGSGDGSLQALQRAPADYIHPEDGAGVTGRLNSKFEEELSEEDRQKLKAAPAGRRRGAARPAAGGQAPSGSAAAANAPAPPAPTPAAAAPSQQAGAARGAASQADRAKKAEKRAELEPAAKPDVDRPAQEGPGIQSSANTVTHEVNSPAEPIVAPQEGAEPKGEKGKEVQDAAAAAAATAQQAFAAASAEPQPPQPMEVKPPEIIEPVDRGGKPLESNPAFPGRAAGIAERAQVLRQDANTLQSKAAEGRANADVLRGNLSAVSGEVSKAEEGVSKSKEHASYRHEVLGQARQALTVSEEKAAKVAAEAPGFTSKADEGAADSGPMRSEASGLEAENAAQNTDDEEAAEKAAEQGRDMGKVSGDSVTMDDAVTQTRSKAGSLAQDAAQAKEKNTQSSQKITESDTLITQTDQRLTEMDTETQQARAQVTAYQNMPGAVEAQAAALDQRAQALLAASYEIEDQLHNAQQAYARGMRAVPALKPWKPKPGEEGGELDESGAGAAATVPAQLWPLQAWEIQRQAEPAEEEAGVEEEIEELAGPGGETGGETGDEAASGEGGEMEAAEPGGEGPPERANIDVTNALPGWLTGVDPESAEDQEAARQREEERQEKRYELMENTLGANFEEATATDKVAFVFKDLVAGYADQISAIKWPGWGGLAKALLDPRTMLTGVTGGLSKMLSGAANLFSAEQWKADPLGNLLQSAADIATGLTIVLASIVGLAGLVAAIMGALILITFGAFSPIGLPVISFCGTVISTVGGWTIAVGKVALVLKALCLIKNLIDAATAQNADQLMGASDSFRTNVNDSATVVMSIAGAKGAQAGVQGVSSRAAGVVTRAGKAGGARALARATVRALPGKTRGAARRLGRKAITAPRRLRRAGRRAATAARNLPSSLASRGRRFRAKLRRRMRAGKPDPALVRQHRQTLRNTRRKSGGQLSKRELEAEMDMVNSARPRRISRGDYTEEVRLPNGHVYRRTRAGGWCRFSKKPTICTMPPGKTPRPKRKNLRRKYLGGTPGKRSRVGRDVQARMRAEGKLRGQEPNIQVRYRGKWYALDDCDMGHRRDAVAYWNKSGYKHGSRSPQVRRWMRDPDNYELEPLSINRSRGAKVTRRYRKPLPKKKR